MGHDHKKIMNCINPIKLLNSFFVTMLDNFKYQHGRTEQNSIGKKKIWKVTGSNVSSGHIQYIIPRHVLDISMQLEMYWCS